jgi:hypothetical protein
MARGRRAADIEAGSRVSMCIDDGVEEGGSRRDAIASLDLRFAVS